MCISLTYQHKGHDTQNSTVAPLFWPPLMLKSDISLTREKTGAHQSLDQKYLHSQCNKKLSITEKLKHVVHEQVRSSTHHVHGLRLTDHMEKKAPNVDI